MARSSARASRFRRSLAAIAIASAAAASLAGCMSGGAPDRTDVGATAAPATPIGEPGPEARCGDGVYTEGDPKLEPSTDALHAGFAVPDALAGFDVLCTLSWRALMNDCEMTFSRAYLDGGEAGARRSEIDEALVAWSTSHGLEQTEIGMFDDTRSYGIEVDPADGALSTVLRWDAVSRYEGADEVQRHADHAGIPLDGADVVVAWSVCPALQGWETPPAGG
ncbi:hypothetical protein EDD26_1654 [Agrococcus jenensis]|uniref:Lipoprotein n=2 Tax=Agrococcus jenensis TaxID=46353 RepID=A0A3N2AU29_9MICO|nr:hypothetical protein EDD26_1654 [Agrococcus jenensis]